MTIIKLLTPFCYKYINKWAHTGIKQIGAKTNYLNIHTHTFHIKVKMTMEETYKHWPLSIFCSPLIQTRLLTTGLISTLSKPLRFGKWLLLLPLRGNNRHPSEEGCEINRQLQIGQAAWIAREDKKQWEELWLFFLLACHSSPAQTAYWILLPTPTHLPSSPSRTSGRQEHCMSRNTGKAFILAFLKRGEKMIVF